MADKSGSAAVGYGMELAAGDINNDGWVNLYVCNLGSNQMLLNNGDGTFTDVTKKSLPTILLWSTSAAFFDYDSEGWLDLFVVNYVAFSLSSSPDCYGNTISVLTRPTSAGRPRQRKARRNGASPLAVGQRRRVEESPD